MRSVWWLVLAACGSSGKASVDAHTSADGPGSTDAMPYSGIANVFVAPNGSDSGSNCMRFSPAVMDPDPSGASLCATFDKAYQLASPGDLVEIEAGTFPYQEIQSAKSGITSEIAYHACAGCQVVIQGLSIGSPYVSMSDMTSYPGDDHETVGGHQALGVIVSASHVTLNRFTAKGAYVWTCSTTPMTSHG
jgi:hypothetical protein